MRATWRRIITIVLVALMVSACAGLRPDSDPMAFAGSPAAPVPPGLHEGVSFSANFDAALRQAQDLRKRAEFDSASRVLGQLVIAAPNDARVIGEYGKVMLESGHTDDAVAFLERAVTLKDTDWTLYSALGIAYDQSAKAEAARAAFNHALALEPGEPAVLTNLALSHLQAGEVDEAERLLLQASEHEKNVPGLADKLAMVRSLKDARRQGSALTVPAATEPVVAPAAPAPFMVEAPQDNTEEPEPATPDDPETDAVAVVVQPPAVIGPPPKIASVPKPAAGRTAPRATASRAPPAQPSVAAEPKRTERAATPRARPAGVARAITRTATIPPLAATSPAEPWELMIRVSLPPPSAAVERPTPVAGAIPPTANRGTEQPSGWSDALERWSSAVLGFFGELWLRAFPDRDPEVA